MAEINDLTLDSLHDPENENNFAEQQTIAHQITRIQAATNTLANTLEWANLHIPTGKKYWNGTEYVESNGTTVINKESSLDALVYALSDVFKQPVESEDFKQVGDGYQIQLPVHTDPETNETIVTSVTLPTGYYQDVKITPVFEESEGNYENVINVLGLLTDTLSTQTYTYNSSDHDFDYVQNIKLTVKDAELKDTPILYKTGIRRSVESDGWISGNIDTPVPESKAYFITSNLNPNIADVVKNNYENTNNATDRVTNKDLYEWVYNSSTEFNPNHILNTPYISTNCNLTYINQSGLLNGASVPIDKQQQYAIRIEPGIIHAPRYILIPSFYSLTYINPLSTDIKPMKAEFILRGQAGFVNGNKVTGSMPDRSKQSESLQLPLSVTDGVLTITPPKGYYDGDKSYGTSGINYSSISDIQITALSEDPEDPEDPNETTRILTSAFNEEEMSSGYYSSGTRYIKVQQSTITPTVNYNPTSNDKVVTFSGQSGWIDKIKVSVNVIDAEITLSDQDLQRNDHIYTVGNKTQGSNDPNCFMKSVNIDLTGLYGTLASI